MKKGQAQFIGWVLLIGFTVVLATFVGNWIVQQARDTTEGLIDMTTKDLRCADVGIAISCEETGIKVINTGYFTIKQIACYSGTGYKSIRPWGDKGLPPSREPKDLSDSCTSIVPIIEVEGKLIGCSEKQIEVKCDEEGY